MMKACVFLAIFGVAFALPQFRQQSTISYPGIPHAPFNGLKNTAQQEQENYPVPAIRSPALSSIDRRPVPAPKSLPREEQFVPIIPQTPAVVRHRDVQREEEDKDFLLEQAKNAKYSFDSQIHDQINDGEITRQETRDGLALKGMYSYSDGFFKRTVHYEADEDGYRVVKEEIEPIGDGPRFNPKGTADVHSSLIGSYHITGDDIRDVRERDELSRKPAERV